MPFSVVVEKDLLGLELGDTTPTIPAEHYLGFVSAETWAASSAYALDAYVVPTTFNSLTGSAGRIFVATTAGTSGTTEPTWPTAAGGTVTDGTVVWTEVSERFGANTLTGAEPTTGGYARVGITNNTTSWPAPSQTGGAPTQVQNGTLLAFPTTTASWGPLAGFVLLDALTAGNLRLWGCLAALSEVATVVGVTPEFQPGTPDGDHLLMPDILVNANSATVTTGGTTAPAAGTVETWTVTAAGWPVLGTGQQFRVLDKADLGKTSGYEIILVTASANGTGVSWTATRGAEGTVPYAHAAGWTCVPVETAGGLPSALVSPVDPIINLNYTT